MAVLSSSLKTVAGADIRRLVGHAYTTAATRLASKTYASGST